MVTPATAAAVRRLAKLQGRSASAVVRDFLTEATPVLERVGNLLDLAMRTKGHWPKALVERLEQAQTGLEATALTHMDYLDLVAADVEAGTQGRPRRRQSPTQPPSSNRGVTNSRRRPKPPRKPS